ncbi:TonB-dependent receptor [Sphingomonas oleivorans]|nr:TonB-dependent receptor [Sphingomonas oleivorans]
MTNGRFTSRMKGLGSVSLAAIAAVVLLPGQAEAQQQAPADQAAGAEEAIVVTGVRASIQRALEQKRNADGIVDAITAEDMGKFPDLNLSESLQRIPGVTLDRNAVGEGQAINLRGLGPEFTRVEINGMSGTSNGTGGRFGNSEGGRGFNFEILASELFTNATVYKTSAADQEEGGLAGLVRLETPKPFDYRGFKLSASAQGNYSEIADKVDPRGALLISQNFDDVFGISASLAYAETTFRSDTAEGGSWRPFAGANTGTRASDAVRAALNANGTRYYHFADDRETLGATLAMQYRPSDTLLLTVDGLYGNLKSDRLALRDDMAIESGANAPLATTIENGVITAGQFTGIQQRVGANFLTTEEDFYQVNARAEWQPADGWTVRPFVGYSRRKADRSFDLYSFRLAGQNGSFDPGVVSYNVRGNFVDFSSTGTDFMSNPQNFLFNVFILRPSQDKDEEFSTKLDVERSFDSALDNIKFGIRYADRDKDRVATQERLQRSAGVAATAVPNLGSVYDLVDYHVSGAGSNAPDKLLSVDLAKLRDTFYPGGKAVTGTFVRPLPGFGAQQSYGIGEKTFNAYAQAEFKLDGFQLISGVRYVRTKQTSSGNQVANLFLPTEVITPISKSKTYSAFLPSLTARYNLTDELVLRAAYSRTLTRPNLADLAPSETVAGIDAGGGTGTRGNPDLDPYFADNLDVGLEWYFAPEGLIAGNAFYKDIKGFIDTRTFTQARTFPRQSDGVLVTGPIVFTEPVNGVSAKIKGFELAAQSRLSFLPGPFSNLGVILNYTYTDSSADFSVANDVRSRGLPGLSKNSFNAVAYYDDGRFDARLAYAWRDRYLAQFSDDFGIPRFTDTFGQLDFSASYNITDNLTAQVQGLNLTKEQTINQSSGRYLPYGVAELDRRFLFGLRLTY